MMSPADRGRFVACYRVSPQKQRRSGFGLQAQKTAVLNYLEARSWQVVGEFTEIESRVALRPIIANFQECGIDTLSGIAEELNIWGSRPTAMMVANGIHQQ
jgi:hypothetical protein